MQTINMEARELEDAINPVQILEKHNRETDGEIITRFPPEPNGYLHIGHAKAMNMSFGYAKERGKTILRYDDTNPEKEEEEYYKKIEEMVGWLKFRPSKITKTSDYFGQIYKYAKELIKKNLAYVDFSAKDEIKNQRLERRESKYRETEIDKNLEEFKKMKQGKYKEGEAVLRCKIDYQHNNPNMRDPIAYRIKYTPHVITGDKWCIYPSYDFSHCLVDSIENITHSFCTLEFEIRRDVYYWILKNLNLYRPFVWEFAKLNITKTILSKRNINYLIQSSIIDAYDDPRLFTLAGLRRRGCPPEVINLFCQEIGVSRSNSTLPIERFETILRSYLDQHSPRFFAVLQPLRVIINDYPIDTTEYFSAPNHPKNTELGTRQISFSRIIYIEQNDFQDIQSKDFFGLTPSQHVGLRYTPYKIICTHVTRDPSSNKILELQCRISTDSRKPKSYIHWINSSTNSSTDPSCHIRFYNNLLLDSNKNDWKDNINLNSKIVLSDSKLESNIISFVSQLSSSSSADNLISIHPFFQLERLGYFTFDRDTTLDNIVLNRIISLNDKSNKFNFF